MTHSTRARTGITSRGGPTVLGWDIGGVNTKAALLTGAEPGIRAIARPYEVQREPHALVPLLRGMAAELGADAETPHAVTMTAELSQVFRTKREGVGFVLDAVEAAFPGGAIHAYTVHGEFLTPAEARARPLEVAASNWAATAAYVARLVPDALLIDIGTTSTDIIPIRGGAVTPSGTTDPARLRSGELVYTGALRTPAEAVAREVPLWGATASVSADGFALIGDAHLWLGTLAPEDYTVAAPDGRPASREFAGERLARVVCADRDMLDDAAIDAIARALAEAQVRSVTEAIAKVRRRAPGIEIAVVTGLGEFIATEAARRAGLGVLPLRERLGAAARTAPAACVAALLAAATAGRPG